MIKYKFTNWIDPTITEIQDELEEEKRINEENLKLIDNLQERVDKAIEYIKDNTFSSKGEIIDDLYYYNIKKLLDILKGEEK